MKDLDRISANAGRILGGSWTPYTSRDNEEVGYFSFSVEQSVALAFAIEDELLAQDRRRREAKQSNPEAT